MRSSFQTYPVWERPMTAPSSASFSRLHDATAVWSGYLDRLSGKRTARLLAEHGVPLIHLHSSGHARVEVFKS